MNFKHLQTFVTICECGTVSRAAAQLRITQPALSRRIKALQEELGLPLFDNLGRRLSLTSEGGSFFVIAALCWPRPRRCSPPVARLAAAEPASCESEELRTRWLPSSRPS